MLDPSAVCPGLGTETSEPEMCAERADGARTVPSLGATRESAVVHCALEEVATAARSGPSASVSRSRRWLRCFDPPVESRAASGRGLPAGEACSPLVVRGPTAMPVTRVPALSTWLTVVCTEALASVTAPDNRSRL